VCLIVSETRFLGLIGRVGYLFMYRRTVSALTISPSLFCSILESWGHSLPRITPSFRRSVAPRDAKRARGVAALGVSSIVPVALARRLYLDTPHGCLTLLRGLMSASKSFGFVDEAPTPCEYTWKRWHTLKRRQPTCAIRSTRGKDTAIARLAVSVARSKGLTTSR